MEKIVDVKFEQFNKTFPNANKHCIFGTYLKGKYQI